MMVYLNGNDIRSFIIKRTDRSAATAKAAALLKKYILKTVGKDKVVKNPKTIDLGLVAIRPEYQNTGINAVILNGMLDILEEGKIKRCETNLNLESNTAVQAQWKYFNARQHKRRRSYKKILEAKDA